MLITEFIKKNGLASHYSLVIIKKKYSLFFVLMFAYYYLYLYKWK